MLREENMDKKFCRRGKWFTAGGMTDQLRYKGDMVNAIGPSKQGKRLLTDVLRSWKKTICFYPSQTFIYIKSEKFTQERKSNLSKSFKVYISFVVLSSSFVFGSISIFSIPIKGSEPPL